MNVEIDLGKVWLPEKLVIMVREHKESILEYHRNNDCYDMLLNASFSAYFSDFMLKNYYKLED